MMVLWVVIVASLAALSTANPLAPIESLLIRQMPSCDGITIPERCTQAANDYTRMVQEIINNPSPDSTNRILNSIRTFLNTICSTECLTPTLRAADCVNNEAARNLTANLICSRQEDGTFCPVKVLEEVTRDGSTGILPTCVSGNSCPPSCQQSYQEVRNRLGCCAASWYGSSSPFSATLGQNFATCDVPLTNPCTPASGAATICLNFLLIAAVFLLSMAMI